MRASSGVFLASPPGQPHRPARRTSCSCIREQDGEPPDRQVDLHLAPADGGVGQPPFVAAVDPAKTVPHLGQAAVAALALAGADSSPAATATSSTITPARCGSRTPSSTTPGHDKHRRLATMTSRTPGRTAGLDNRWTTGVHSFRPVVEIITDGGISADRTSRKILVRQAATTTASSGLFSSGPLK